MKVFPFTGPTFQSSARDLPNCFGDSIIVDAMKSTCFYDFYLDAFWMDTPSY